MMKILATLPQEYTTTVHDCIGVYQRKGEDVGEFDCKVNSRKSKNRRQGRTR
ncbi:hypothetical protein WN48_06162 [Eufriesea mexicana]|uniref:Uncharacterized protein n=1 Tax=Eufriesea mexicana TaxID=516756 RepID=A0A310SSM1_9HYME|nr:hypothetical protein WN48_06162 [Eufriesea mexicana]